MDLIFNELIEYCRSSLENADRLTGNRERLETMPVERFYQIGLRERRDVSLLLMIVKEIHGEEDLTRYRLIVTLVTVTNVYTLATRFPMNP